MYFTKCLILAAAVATATASTDYCDEEPETSQTTSIVTYPTADSSEPIATSTEARTFSPAIVFHASPESSSTTSPEISSTSAAPIETSSTGEPTTLTLTETSTSHHVPTLTAAHKTIRPAIALCVPNGTLCPGTATSTASPTSTSTTTSCAEDKIAVALAKMKTHYTTSTKTLTRLTERPSVKRRGVRQSCAGASSVTASLAVPSDGSSETMASVLVQSSTVEVGQTTPTEQVESPSGTESVPAQTAAEDAQTTTCTDDVTSDTPTATDTAVVAQTTTDSYAWETTTATASPSDDGYESTDTLADVVWPSETAGANASGSVWSSDIITTTSATLVPSSSAAANMSYVYSSTSRVTLSSTRTGVPYPTTTAVQAGAGRVGGRGMGVALVALCVGAFVWL